VKKNKWLQKATARMEKKGTKGAFSAEAKRHGMSTEQYARKILSSKNATPLQKKRAVFALNAIKAAKKKK
jgi:plasmid stability protein